MMKALVSNANPTQQHRRLAGRVRLQVVHILAGLLILSLVCWGGVFLLIKLVLGWRRPI